MFGPKRIYPGRLAVSRAFGDIEAKVPRLGGMHGVLIAEPDVKKVRLDTRSGFLVLMCDGIIDHQTNR